MCALVTGVQTCALPIALALLFLPPLYILLMVMEARRRTALLAVAAGVLAVPPLELVLPDWGVVIGGLVGGTFAFLLSRALVDRRVGGRRSEERRVGKGGVSAWGSRGSRDH